MAAAPRDEYSARLDARRTEIARLSRADAWFAAARLATAAAAALLAWQAFGAGRVAAWWLLLPVVAFLALAVAHDRLLRRRAAATRAVEFYDRGLARLDDRWIGTGDTGTRFLDSEHLYAADLDVFGTGSLFELLSLARTQAGEERLAAWLTHPASPVEIGARHAAVADLRARLDLREDLASAGADVRTQVNTGALASWSSRPPELRGTWPRVIAALLAAAAIASSTAWLWTGRGGGVLLAVIAAEVLFSSLFRRRVRRVVHAADEPARELAVLAEALARVEREPFASSRLLTLRDGLSTHGLTASAAVRRLQRLVAFHDWQHNQFFAPLAALVLWSTQLAFAIEQWRIVHGHQVAAWIDTIGDIEALASLAAYAYEHPADRFPELTDAAQGALFEAEALAHPLLPRATAVPNAIAMDARGGEAATGMAGPAAASLPADGRARAEAPAVYIVSGSNMSGKSTLLRAVGLNAVLALAGAPVRARRLRLSPLAIGGTLRIEDSLHAGRSRFYAEIVRLRRIVDLVAGPLPVLFLLDELLFGTNSHDRALGAERVIANLARRGAIGLVTTHDLAVTDIAQRLGSRVANVHFEDRLDEGELAFDYVIRPGPVTRSNAIALMRAVGLDVDAEPGTGTVPVPGTMPTPKRDQDADPAP